jgi:hypothetical protein
MAVDSKAKFEDVLDIIGHIGLMQWIIILFSIIQETSVALSIYFLVFAESTTPSWTCARGNSSSHGLGYNETALVDVCSGKGGTKCDNLTYNVGFTSIVTEVSL